LGLGQIPGLRYLTSPLGVSAFLGEHEYAIWKIEQDLTTIDTDYKAAVLLCWIELGIFDGGHSGGFKLIEFFLRRGQSPQGVYTLALGL
jgi:hypothetical protein